MIGGMVSSTLLTLIVIPAVFGLVRGRALPSGDLFAAATAQEAPAGEPAIYPGSRRVNHQEKSKEMSL
jgi:Cu(I)/Ag(I) efflux system membrane protein CusA/SilA